jgi:hypothetical protein
LMFDVFVNFNVFSRYDTAFYKAFFF